MTRCNYCKNSPDGPGIIAVAKSNGEQAFKGCINCLVSACNMFTEENSKCRCELYNGCTCGAIQPYKAGV